MIRYALIIMTSFLFVACSKQTQPDEEALPSTISPQQNDQMKDVDTLSINNHMLQLERKKGNIHFSLHIDLPNSSNAQVNRNILSWINWNMQEEANAESICTPENISSEKLLQFLGLYNRKFTGDVMNYPELALFYANKFFTLYGDEGLGVECTIDCRRIYETKDVVSYEITETFNDYSRLKSDMLVRGATFFKYNGNRLSWNLFEDSNVKSVVKNAVNSQFFKLTAEKYNRLLQSTRYGAFSLPDNTPYMTFSGLKFTYRKREFSEKIDEQIICVVPLQQMNLMPDLMKMLQ